MSKHLSVLIHKGLHHILLKDWLGTRTWLHLRDLLLLGLEVVLTPEELLQKFGLHSSKHFAKFLSENLQRESPVIRS